MPEKITVNVPHKLTEREVRERIDKGFSKVQEKTVGKSVDVSQSWEGDRMTFKAGAMGQNLTGKLHIQPNNVFIEINLPWFLAKLSGTVQEKLKKGTQLLLDKK